MMGPHPSNIYEKSPAIFRASKACPGGQGTGRDSGSGNRQTKIQIKPWPFPHRDLSKSPNLSRPAKWAIILPM